MTSTGLAQVLHNLSGMLALNNKTPKDVYHELKVIYPSFVVYGLASPPDLSLASPWPKVVESEIWHAIFSGKNFP